MGTRRRLIGLAYRTASRIYGAAAVRGVPKPGLRILMYHAVGTEVPGDVHGLYNVPPAVFRAQLKHLVQRRRENFVSLSRLPPDYDDLRVAVTFDDGYRDNLLAAAPVLTELRVPFTVFVTTAPVSAGAAGYLSAAEVRELAALPGAQIGSHTVTHPQLTSLDNSRLRAELRDSKAYLEEILGSRISALSYPHGSVDRRVRDAAEESGYTLAASSRWDVNSAARDPLLLCRTTVWPHDNPSVLAAKVNGMWDWNRWRNSDPAMR